MKVAIVNNISRTSCENLLENALIVKSEVRV